MRLPSIDELLRHAPDAFRRFPYMRDEAAVDTAVADTAAAPTEGENPR